MIQESGTSKLGLKIYYILWEVFIAFGSFMIFFGIFIKYYFHALEENLINGYIKSSMSFYKPLFNYLNQYNIFSNLINENIDINKLNYNIAAEDEIIMKHNNEYDNLLIKLIIYIFAGFLIILFLPILLSLIPFSTINWNYLGLNFLLHIILIVIFEIILLYYIIPINNPIELNKLFDNIKF